MKIFIAALAVLLASFVLMGQAVEQDPATEDPGELVFKTVCATCHSLDPPPDKAPPMKMVLRHYMQADLEDPWQAVRDWVVAPDSARSALPAHAVERFGLMPPLVMEDADMDALIEYLQGQVATDSLGTMQMGNGQGMQHGNGQGMQHGNGQSMRHGNGQGMQHRQGNGS